MPDAEPIDWQAATACLEVKDMNRKQVVIEP